MSRIIATIWVCDNCGAYYASSSEGDLTMEWNRQLNTNQRTFPRSRCPTPACTARQIDRRPVRVPIELDRFNVPQPKTENTTQGAK